MTTLETMPRYAAGFVPKELIIEEFTVHVPDVEEDYETSTTGLTGKQKKDVLLYLREWPGVTIFLTVLVAMALFYALPANSWILVITYVVLAVFVTFVGIFSAIISFRTATSPRMRPRLS